MAEYKICFSVAGAFGAQIRFEAKPGVSYEDAAASINKEKLAELMCLSALVCSVKDIRLSRRSNTMQNLERLTMDEYIKREAAVKSVLRMRRPENSVAQNRMLSIIQMDMLKLPAADVAPVVYGRWVHLCGDEWCCSACGFVITTEGNWDKPAKKYCEDCGAKMDGGADK